LTLVQETREELLRILMRGLSLVAFVLVVLAFLFSRERVEGLAYFIFFGVATLGLFGLTFLPRIPYRVRAVLLLLMFYIAGLQELLRAGMLGDGRMWLVAFTMMTFILLGIRSGVFAVAVSIGTVGIVGRLISTDTITFVSSEVQPYLDSTGFHFLTLTFSFAAAVVLFALIRVLNSARATIAAETELAAELEQERQLVEQRVRLRAKALQTSAAIGRDLSTILEPDRLVETVVNRLREARGYYHVHIFLLTPTNTLQSTAASGEASKELVQEGFTITPDVGVVGRAARTMETVLAPDVVLEPDWFAHPLLPDTRSEMAAPLMAGQNLIGVLDVQQDVTGGLDDNDAVLLNVVAAQLAVALQNARYYAAAQRRAELEERAADAGRAIARTTTVTEALQVAAREVGEMLGAERTMVEVSGQNGRAHRKERPYG
jgi:putative methionine-R-sulfoxide reductase with GAF domain